MRIDYNQFHTNFGNRNETKVARPRIFNLSKMNLPKQKVIHYLPGTDSDVGPSENLPLFADVTTRVPMYTYFDTATKLGSMQRQTYNHLQELKKHIKHNYKLEHKPDLKKIAQNPLVPLVMNYCLVDKQYKYIGTPVRIGYYKNMNLLNTLIQGMVDVYNAHNGYHHQFVILNIPDQLPRVSELKRACLAEDTKFFSTFNHLDVLMVFELWKWLGVRRDASVFAKMPLKLLERINIVLSKNGVFTTFNMALLDSWRKSKENPTGKVEPSQLSKNFIIALATLNNASSDKKLVELTEEELIEQREQDVSGTDDEVFTPKTSKETPVDDDTDTDDDEEEIAEADDADDTEVESGQKLEIDLSVSDVDDVHRDDLGDIVGQLIDEEDDFDIEVDNAKVQVMRRELNKSKVVNDTGEQKPEFEELEDDIDSSDMLDLKNIKPEEVPVLVHIPTQTKTLDEKARAYLDEHAKEQNMTVSKYDGIRKSLGKFRTLKVADDVKMTVGEMIDTKPQELELTEEERSVSSLAAIDKRYIEEHLERDTVAMLTAIQAGGAIVQDIKRTTVENIAGGYVSYSMKIRPIEGEPSTIRVRLPKVEPDGSFKVGSSVYHQKHQRND